MSLWMENLQRLVDIVEDKLAAADTVVGSYSRADYERWSARRRSAEEALVEHFTRTEDARFSRSGDAESIRMAGIRSSSTQGVTAALRNWRTAAQLKLAHEQSDPEQACAGHVSAAEGDPKVCMRCGVHIDCLRPDEDDVINLQGSGPAPIVERELF